MTLYEMLKIGHVTSVVISGSLFIYRYAWLNTRTGKPLSRMLRVLPHINDTILLACALGMLLVAGLNPFEIPWLLGKIVALIAYIGIGMACLRAVPRSAKQAVSFVGAMIVFAYIVMVALSKQLTLMA